MKRFIMTAAISALALGTAMADRPVVEQKTQADNANYKYVPVTGSHIKQKAKKRNIITVTRHNNLLTIDQREMQRNGMGSIADQLSRYPGVSISGGR
jgi:outer membrane receptor for Fe3+-dicitrate